MTDYTDDLVWYLVQISCWDDPYWVNDGGGWWINSAGGRIPKGKDDKIFEIAYGEYEDLDHTKTGLKVKESKSGWLDREGQYYPCRYYEHDIYACLILRKTVRELERLGWVRINGKNNWHSEKRLNQTQLNWLYEHGYKVNNYDDIEPWLDA